MGGRIGRVGVVEAAEKDEDGLKLFVVDFFSACINVVDDGKVNGCPGKKAGAVGLSTVAEGWSFLCSEVTAIVGGVGPALWLMSGTLLGNPDGTLCEATKLEGAGPLTLVARVDNVDVVELAKGDPKTDVAVPCSRIFDKTGADVDAVGMSKEEPAFADSRSTDDSPIEPETGGTEEDDPKADEVVPKAEEEPPNADAVPKDRLPKTFGVALRFANAEAADPGTEDEADSGPGMEELNAEAGDTPKTEVDKPAPGMNEDERRTSKLFVGHSVALGFTGLGWC
jgi:hypothetical protein